VRDLPAIVGGLILFMGLVTAPIWHGTAARKAALTAPPFKRPAQEEQCVAPTQYMRTSHMLLLEEWRNDAVREQNRQFVAYNGKLYDRDLTRTCFLQCHKDRAEFCDRCHGYVGVSDAACWDCHNAPPPGRRTP
jgi:hypothetical protein